MDAPLLAGWENFYVITGSCAGGLTGITFVIITLIRDVQRLGPTHTGLRAFVTPTIVHFSGVLALAAYLSMPHQGVMSLSVGFAAAGLGGLREGGPPAGAWWGPSQGPEPRPLVVSSSK